MAHELSPSDRWWPSNTKKGATTSSGNNSGSGGAGTVPLYSCPYGKNVGVEVREVSPEKGKGLFATRAFRPGDVIFEEMPFIATPLELEDEHQHEGHQHSSSLSSSIGWTCEECIKAVGLSIWESANIALKANQNQNHLPEEDTPPLNGDIVRVQIKSQYRAGSEVYEPVVVKCDKGSDAIYCSARCRDAAKPVHGIVCSSKKEGDAFSALREYSRIIGNPIGLIIGKTLTRVLSTINGSEQTPDEALKERLNDLFEHYCSFTNETDKGEGEGGEEAEQAKMRKAILEKIIELLTHVLGDPERKRFPSLWNLKTIEKLYSAINLNQQEIKPLSPFDCYWNSVEEDVQPVVEECLGPVLEKLGERGLGNTCCTRGAGLYWLQSRMNHACDPNAAVGSAAADAMLTVKAKKRIAKGDEICFDYIKIAGLPVAVKRNLLLSKYHFLCQCRVCQLYDEEQRKAQEKEEQQNTRQQGSSSSKPKGKGKKNNNKKKKRK